MDTDAKAQQEFRKYIDLLLALEDQQVQLRRQISRCRKMSKRDLLSSQLFTLGLRIRNLEKHIIQTFR